MKKVNLNQLELLTLLLEEKSVRLAAERANMTQPALSKVLRKLRDEFHDPLLIRSGNDMIISSLGKSLLVELKPIFKKLNSIIDPAPFDPIECHDELIIASTEYFGTFVLPEFLSTLQIEAPKLRLGLRNWDPEQIREIEYGRLDFGATIFTGKPELPESISHAKFGEDYLVCLMDQQHSLAAEELTLKNYLNCNHIAVSSGNTESNLEKYFRVNGDPRKIRFKTAYFSSALAILKSSQYLFTTPLHIAGVLSKQFDCCIKTLPQGSPKLSYHLLWPALKESDKPHQWVKQRLLEFKRENFDRALKLGTDKLDKL